MFVQFLPQYSYPSKKHCSPTSILIPVRQYLAVAMAEHGRAKRKETKVVECIFIGSPCGMKRPSSNSDEGLYRGRDTDAGKN